MPAHRASNLAARLKGFAALPDELPGSLDGRPVAVPRARALDSIAIGLLRARDYAGWARWALADATLDADQEVAHDLLASVVPAIHPAREPLVVTVDDADIRLNRAALGSPRLLALLAAGRWASWAHAVALDDLPSKMSATDARALAVAAVDAAEAAG